MQATWQGSGILEQQASPLSSLWSSNLRHRRALGHEGMSTTTAKTCKHVLFLKEMKTYTTTMQQTTKKGQKSTNTNTVRIGKCWEQKSGVTAREEQEKREERGCWSAHTQQKQSASTPLSSSHSSPSSTLQQSTAGTGTWHKQPWRWTKKRGGEGRHRRTERCSWTKQQ